MADPDFDIVSKVAEIIDDEWDTNSVTKPGTIRETRKEKSVAPGTDEYILVSGNPELLPTWRGARQTRDHDGAAFAEVMTIQSHARRMELYNEIDRIMVAMKDRRDANQNSSRSEPIGNWDHVDYQGTIRDEEIFDVFPIEYTFTFNAFSRKPD